MQRSTHACKAANVGQLSIIFSTACDCDVILLSHSIAISSRLLDVYTKKHAQSEIQYILLIRCMFECVFVGVFLQAHSMIIS